MADTRFAHLYAVSCAYVGLSLAALLMIVGVSTAAAQVASYVVPSFIEVASTPQPVAAATVMAIMPRCVVVTDRDTYAQGSMMQIYWLASNTTSAVFVPEANLLLMPPPGQFGHSGMASLVAAPSGSHQLMLRVYNAAGQSATCSKTISIAP